MGKRRRRDLAHPGETQHAEGQHGPKAHQAFLDGLKSGREDDREAIEASAPRAGRHRLAENREQHDEADKNSDINRMQVEVSRGRLDPDIPGVGDRLNGGKPGHQ